MTHQATNMTVMKGGAERFSEGVGGIDNAGNVFQNDFMVSFPLLDGKMLNIDVA